MSYFVSSRNQTLEQIAAAGDWSFIGWAAYKMSNLTARDEARALDNAHLANMTEADYGAEIAQQSGRRNHRFSDDGTQFGNDD